MFWSMFGSVLILVKRLFPIPCHISRHFKTGSFKTGSFHDIALYLTRARQGAQNICLHSFGPEWGRGGSPRAETFAKGSYRLACKILMDAVGPKSDCV